MTTDIACDESNDLKICQLNSIEGVHIHKYLQHVLRKKTHIYTLCKTWLMKLLMLLPKVIDDVTGDVKKFISTSIIKRLLDSIEMISDVEDGCIDSPFGDELPNNGI